MEKSELLSLAGLVGCLTVAGFVGKVGGDYINQRASERKDEFPKTELVRYYTKDGKDYAELMHSYRSGMKDMPGSFIKSERYSVPSNNVPDLVEGQKIR